MSIRAKIYSFNDAIILKDCFCLQFGGKQKCYYQHYIKLLKYNKLPGNPHRENRKKSSIPTGIYWQTITKVV